MLTNRIDDTTTIIAKRITNVMGSLCLHTSSSEDTHKLQGLGLALAFVFEETTGISAKNKKPSELMIWAIELPEPLVRKVSVEN